jgi:hypothetical protein
MTFTGARTAAALAALAAMVLTGCSNEPAEEIVLKTPTAESVPPPGSATAPGTVSKKPWVKKTFRYELYTHCGINGAQIGSVYYAARTPLSDGSGNPPDGWGNPGQEGTMTLVSEKEAVFTDSLGHRVEFHVKPGVTGPPGLCK